VEWGPPGGATGEPGPYLFGGREAGERTQVGGVSDKHGLWEQACMCVLGHLGLVAVEGWPGGREEERGGHGHGTLDRPDSS
jgi:hypothetical protein